MKLQDIRNEDDLIPFGEAFFDASAKSKRRVEQQWLLDIAFIAGDQLVNINHHTGNLDRINTVYDPEWRIRIVDNRILPIYRTMISKLTKNKPLPSAKAHSREEADIQAGRAAVKLLENHWDTLNFDEIHPEKVGWMVATGNAFGKPFWNSKKGDRVIDLREMDTEAGLTEKGEPQFKSEADLEKVDFTLGDTDYMLRSPFNVYPQPGKTKIRDMKIFGDAEIMDVDEIETLYGKRVEPEKDTKYVKIANVINSTINSGGITERDSDNSATVKELYILPCTAFPNGIEFRWAKQTLLYVKEECYEIPHIHFGLIDIPGQFWYKGIIDDVIPLQRRWNQLLSKIEMHNDYYNDPPILVDEDVIPVEQWTTEPGNLIGIKQKGIPLNQAVYQLPVPELDMAIFKELEILDAQFEIVPVLNKVSYGKETPNAKSGIAINFLQEKDDDVIRPLIDQIEAGYAKVFKADFKLCQENYKEDRGFAIVGEDNKVEWIEFTKANLEANIDVGVEPGSAMPRSKVAQQAMVMDMLNAGFFNNPQTGQPDYAKALKYMEFGSVDDIYQDNALDTNQAKRENERIKDGGEAVAEDWHNHEAHIYEHNRLRKGANYETEEWTPEAKQKMSDHIAEHIAFMQPPAPPAPPPGTEIDQNQPIEDPTQPSPEEVMAFLQDIQQTDPEMYAELMAFPPEDQNAAILEAFMAAQQPQMM